MKKMCKFFMVMALVVSVCTVCGTTVSCATEQANMYQTNHSSTKVINKNYRVKGTNKSNSSTYRSY
ncbi:MAG: hypothetical protein KBT04_03255 [Bacteroidales bacterium]|nr:hypothetical protein [Candidatus Colimorpha onthohippi]